MKVIALSAVLALTSAVQYRGFGYADTYPHDRIGSRWGLKPTQTWIPGPGGKINAPQGSLKDPKGDYDDAVERQRKQFESFAVDSIHQNGDFSQIESMGVPVETVGSQWGLKPTQTWIPGPGGDKDQQEAEADQKKATMARSIDSVVPNVVAQRDLQTTDGLVEQIIDAGMTPVAHY